MSIQHPHAPVEIAALRATTKGNTEMSSSTPLRYAALCDRFPTLPRTALIERAFDYARDNMPDHLFNHVTRSWISTRVAEENAIEYDAEVVAVATLIHDIGFTPRGEGPDRFEVNGAIVAADFARKLGFDDRRTQLVWDSVALHATASISLFKEIEVALCARGLLVLGLLFALLGCGGPPVPAAAAGTPAVAVAPQYDTTHVYVQPEDVDRFAQSFVATFGGQSTKPTVVTVTPVASSTTSQLVQTPVGLVSLFGYTTPVPAPFGAERTGYLVTDLDVAVSAARAAGADVIVAPFTDPIGRDAIVQFPGAVNMQLYWHYAKPATPPPPLQTVPENRVYLSIGRADDFVRSFVRFAHAVVVSDEARAPGIEIGRPTDTYRRIRLESAFGKVVALVTDGHLPYPFGHELTGYEVTALGDTLAKARAAGVVVLVEPYSSDGRQCAMLRFPGGYVAEVHSRSGSTQETP